MTPAEPNYSVTVRECLAVLWTIRKFRSYVGAYLFTVITDHSSLKWLCNLHNPTGRQGSLNYVPDELFRMYEDETDVELASDAWYKRMSASVAANPIDHPYWKIVHGRIYSYCPHPMIEDLMKDEDAWKLVSGRSDFACSLHRVHCYAPSPLLRVLVNHEAKRGLR